MSPTAAVAGDTVLVVTRSASGATICTAAESTLLRSLLSGGDEATSPAVLRTVPTASARATMESVTVCPTPSDPICQSTLPALYEPRDATVFTRVMLVGSASLTTTP